MSHVQRLQHRKQINQNACLFYNPKKIVSAFLQIFQLMLGQKNAKSPWWRHSWTSVFHYLDPSLPLLKSGHKKLWAHILVNFFFYRIQHTGREFTLHVKAPGSSPRIHKLIFFYCYRKAVTLLWRIERWRSPTRRPNLNRETFHMNISQGRLSFDVISSRQCDQIGRFIGLWAIF